MTSKSDHRLTFSQLSACTVVSGCISRTLTSPLDVLKITKQVGIVESKGALLQLCSSLKQRDGFRAFWKGNMIGCSKVLPYSLLHYFVYQQLKWELSDELGRMSIWKRLITGMTAGIVATITLYPIDMVKTRIIIQPINKNLSAYKGFIDAILNIVKNERRGALYKGLKPTLMGSLPYALSTYVVYEILDQVWWKPKYSITSSEVMVQGCLASAVAMVVSFPFDVVRRKMQAHSSVLPLNGGVDVSFKSTSDCFKVIARYQGLKGFWSGVIPALLRVLPYHAILFLTFDLCKSFCLYYNGYTSSIFDDERLEELDQNIDIEEIQDITDYDIELPVDKIHDNVHQGEGQVK